MELTTDEHSAAKPQPKRRADILVRGNSANDAAADLEADSLRRLLRTRMSARRKICATFERIAVTNPSTLQSNFHRTFVQLRKDNT